MSGCHTRRVQARDELKEESILRSGSKLKSVLNAENFLGTLNDVLDFVYARSDVKFSTLKTFE